MKEETELWLPCLLGDKGVRCCERAMERTRSMLLRTRSGVSARLKEFRGRSWLARRMSSSPPTRMELLECRLLGLSRVRPRLGRRDVMRAEIAMFCWVARCSARSRIEACAERGVGLWKGVRSVVREPGRNVVMSAP